MKDIDLAKLKADIALRKDMPDFGPETSIERLRIINATKDSFTPAVMEMLIDQLENTQHSVDYLADRQPEAQHNGMMQLSQKLAATELERDEAVILRLEVSTELSFATARYEKAEAEIARRNAEEHSWIPLSEKQPERGDDEIWLYVPKGKFSGVRDGYAWDGATFCDWNEGSMILDGVTHWMHKIAPTGPFDAPPQSLVEVTSSEDREVYRRDSNVGDSVANVAFHMGDAITIFELLRIKRISRKIFNEHLGQIGAVEREVWSSKIGPKLEIIRSMGGVTLNLLTAAQPAVLPPEYAESEDFSDYHLGWNSCRNQAIALGCQPEKVVKLPAQVSSDNVAYGGSGAFNMGKRCGINEGIIRCSAALDAAGVKWEVTGEESD